MLKISDQVFLDLLIDRQPIPSTNGFFSSLILTEGNGMISPALQLKLRDRRGTLSRELALTDGNEIAVMVGKSDNDPNLSYRQFRLFSPKGKPNSDGPLLDIVCLYDAPAFLQQSVSESYSGNSSQALKALAERCLLSYTGPEDFNGRTPDDNQIWRSIGKTRSVFARHLARHGYMGEGSAMSVVLNSKGQLIYRNLNDVINVDHDRIKHAFYLNVGNKDTSTFKKHRVRQAKDRSSSGLANAWLNYGHLRINPTIDGQDKVLSKISVPTNAANFAINRKVANAIKTARIDYGYIDANNVHEFSEEAEYQNLRLMALFSQRLSIMVTEPTEVELYEPVIYRQEDLDGADIKNTDIYVVIGKTIAILNGTFYCERIELARHQVTMPTEDLTTVPTPDPSTTSSGFYISSASTSVTSVSSLTKTVLNAFNQFKPALAVLRAYGPQFINQSSLNAAMNAVASASTGLVGAVASNGGAGYDTTPMVSSVDNLTASYQDSTSSYTQLLNTVNALQSSVAGSTPQMRTSVVGQLPVNFNDVVASAVSTLKHTQAASKSLSYVSGTSSLYSGGMPSTLSTALTNNTTAKAALTSVAIQLINASKSLIERNPSKVTPVDVNTLVDAETSSTYSDYSGSMVNLTKTKTVTGSLPSTDFVPTAKTLNPDVLNSGVASAQSAIQSLTALSSNWSTQ